MNCIGIINSRFCKGKGGFKYSNPKSLLTDADLVRLFQVTPSCLYRWRRKNVLPFLKVSYSVYYIKDEIETFLRHRSRMNRLRQEDWDTDLNKPKH
ncbi:helix-turn-helix domain-containing protein [Leeuwenhoekiella sp. UBA6783]|uniref:helix-turn-helix domain-containing protein n=1 Tax=Leeuwenhoekiella sp. UBA6783 TaxID=1946747 RepID=UPI0025C6DBB5|nr:helix-turn-helix domain-containing protein [Leeuwenhoekiella sp. UBA6783]